MKTRYVFVKDMFFDFPMKEYSFPFLVYAIDLQDMCGFTPQDWNFSWVPSKEFTEVSLEEFKNISKNLKTRTTHFRIPNKKD